MRALITDVSMVLLFPTLENYRGSLNQLYKEKSNLPVFRFFDFFKLNIELLNYYQKLDLKIHILTSDIIQEATELQPYWLDTIDNIFSASKMGTTKEECATYEKVLQKINVPADQTIYIDDNEKNIAAAQTVGLATILYQNNHQVISDIKRLLASENK